MGCRLVCWPVLPASLGVHEEGEQARAGSSIGQPETPPPSLVALPNTINICSVHARENEGVVAAVLPAAAAAGFRLADPFPAWPRRGVPGLVAGAEKLVRVDPDEDGTDGFFVALFVKDDGRDESGGGGGGQQQQPPGKGGKRKKKDKQQAAAA